MNNQQKGFIVPLVLVLIAILVVGGGTYFYTKNKPENTNKIEVSENTTNTVSETPKKSVTPSPSQANTKKLTFSDFIKQGGSYVCSVSRYIDRGFAGDAKMSGTAYINGKLIRVDYDPNMLSLIYKDNKTYWWWGTQNPNYKYSPNDGHVEESQTSTYSWKSGDITDYECKTWTPDNSKFVVPSNLVFPQMIKPLCQYRSDLKPPDCDN